MKLFQGRISENMGIQNPFTMLKDWFNSPGIEAIEEAVADVEEALKDTEESMRRYGFTRTSVLTKQSRCGKNI